MVYPPKTVLKRSHFNALSYCSKYYEQSYLYFGGNSLQNDVFREAMKHRFRNDSQVKLWMGIKKLTTGGWMFHGVEMRNDIADWAPGEPSNAGYCVIADQSLG